MKSVAHTAPTSWYVNESPQFDLEYCADVHTDSYPLYEMTAARRPFNFTISDQSPLFFYLPFRDGPINSGWNVSYTESEDSSWIGDVFIGRGNSSHRTSLAGATAQLHWTGTAIYLYGTARPGSYGVDIDGAPSGGVVNATDSVALLFSKSGLSYGPHTMVFRAMSGPLSISYAIITAGMGDPSVNIENRTVPITNASSSFPGFVLSDGWTLQPATYSTTGVTYPRVGTTTQGAYISFSIQSAVAFSIHGSVNYNHGGYSVSVYPPSDLGPPQISQFNSSSHWIGLDAMLYLQTEMDRSREYRVQISNDTPDQWLDVAAIRVYDSPPLLSPSKGFPSNQSHQALKTPAIIGIALGVFAFTLLIILLVTILLRRRRRPVMQVFEIDAHSEEQITAGQFIPTPYLSQASYSHQDPRTDSISGLQPVALPYESTSYFTSVPFPMSAQPSDPRPDPNTPSKSRSNSNATRGDASDTNHTTGHPTFPAPVPAASTSRMVVHHDITDRSDVELPPLYSPSRVPLIFVQQPNRQHSRGTQNFRR